MFKKSQQESDAPALQAFILESILTPSALVDTGLDDAIALDSVDDLDIFGDEWPQDGDEPQLEPPETELEMINFATSLESIYESGEFTVTDPSGKVEIDFLFDGGAYRRGEVAIFSLEGMDEFEPGSSEFIQEAARRALSGSEQGHVVISDATEGARFSGAMREGDYNSGNYVGVQGYQMRAGDRFGFMLASNHSIEEVANGKIENVRFSMSTSNPNDALYFGQIADVTGDGNTFAFEDVTLERSDRDYNDIVLQVRGATAETALMDDVVAEGRDWRTQDMGQALIEYANAYTDSIDYTAAQFEAAREFQPLVGVIDTGVNVDALGLDADDILIGSDFIDGDDNSLLADGEGDNHGTQVVGLINGINDDAPLWVGRAVGSGQWASSLVEFVDAAVESGQPNAIANLSLDLTQIDADGNITTRTEFTPMEMAALEYARQNNVLIAVASGNQAGLMSALGQASMQFDNIITVGAAEQLDPTASNWQGYDRASYSSYGQGLDILANGGNGSSMAAAQVTGAISQVWAANPNLSYQQAIALLKQTATDLGTANPDLETGAGLLNVAAAVHLAKTIKAEEYDKDLKNIPITWIGEGKVKPMERAAAPTVTLSGSGQAVDAGSGMSLNSFLGIFGNSISSRFQEFLKKIYEKFHQELPAPYSTPAPSWPKNTSTVAGGLYQRWNNTWVRMPGKAGDIGIGSDGSMWITGKDHYGVWKWTGSTWQEVSKAQEFGGGAVRIAVAPDGTPWVLNSEGAIYRRVNNTWKKENGKAGDIGIGADGSVWITGKDHYGVWKWTGSNWQEVSKAGEFGGEDVDGGAIRVSVAPDGVPFVINGSHTSTESPGNGAWQNPLDSGTYTILPGAEFRDPQRPSHNGIDLSTWHSNPFVPVKAAKAGKVVEVGYHPNGWGHFIRMRHGDEFQTVYAHLSQVDVSEGQIVSSGQKIGNVGSSGNSGGPHLHFEIYVSPFRWPEDTRNPRNYIQF